MLQANGSTKYRLNKELYETKQDESTISEYFTKMNGIWEELEALNQLPSITEMTLEEACASLQQEEEQREVLNIHKVNAEVSTMSIKEPKSREDSNSGTVKTTKIEECKACGKKGHPREKCSTIMGYPKGHYKAKKQMGMYGRDVGPQWNKNKFNGGSKYANAVKQGERSNGAQMLTPQQIEKLLKLIPEENRGGSDNEDEVDTVFIGMAICLNASVKENEWIVDSGVTDHMIADKNAMINSVVTKNSPKINLPTGLSFKDD
ncbi:Pleckstrin homology domain-containing family A member 8 [Bienertia sinuspersici]